MYTLIMVDPDIPASSFASESRPLVHWLVTNIEDGNMSTGRINKARKFNLAWWRFSVIWCNHNVTKCGTIAIFS